MIVECDLPPSGTSREFLVETPEGRVAGFLVRCGERLHAYRNRCPHTGVPLNWMPDRFLTPEGDLIQCATHGALFRLEDGFCVFGPCAGQALEALSVRVDGTRVKIEVQET